MRVIAYIDGFNLYYRALRRTPSLKWLDPRAFLSHFLLPDQELTAIHYYTADVSGKIDPQQPERQRAYLRALKTVPTLSIHKSTFLFKSVWRPLAKLPDGVSQLSKEAMVFINDSEEKGSDVKLASHIIRDGFLERYDLAMVVSADTDLEEPLRIVKEEIGLPVGLIFPDRSRQRSLSLQRAASFVRHIDTATLRESQFPDEVRTTRNRSIARPSLWR